MSFLLRFRFSWLYSFADHLRARRGWRRAATAFVYGAVCSLAFPPADAVPVLWISFPALIFLMQGTQNWQQAFVTGWSFAFGLFTFGLYWIAASMFVDLRHFWWAVPLAVFGLPIFLAIHYGIACAVARRIGVQNVSGIVAFALLWFLADYVRGHILTGFPWNLEGYAWAEFIPVLQITSIIGIYGLTLATLIIACLPASLARDAAGKPERFLTATGLVLLGLIALWGGARVAHAPTTTVAGVRLRLVQPNVSQQMKWQPVEREENFSLLLQLSSAPGLKPVTHVIWPETAATFYLTQDEVHRRAAAAVAPEKGALITGVLRSDYNRNTQVYRFYNSLIAIDHDSNVTAVYDKFHLVPFGEYIPFRHILPLPPIAGMGLDFSHGPGPQTLHVQGLPPFSPLICYEAIFPGQVIDHHDQPQFLLNVTNDGWYGHTAGPYQHFAIARVRAVEEGLPLVRAAYTGISGVIDAYGRIQADLGLGKSGFVDSDLPQALSQPTFFSRSGEKPLWLIFVLLVLAIFFGRFLTKNKRK